MNPNEVEKLERELKRITAQAKELEKARKQKLESKIKKIYECCDDVCSSINKIIESLNSDIRQLNLQEKSMKKQLLEFGVTSEKPLIFIKSSILLTQERIKELERLKTVLKMNDICVCK